jgi:short-subunit dehydrogenase
MEADDLAARTMLALAGRQPVLVPGLLNRSLAALASLLPQAVSARLSSAFSRRYRGR